MIQGSVVGLFATTVGGVPKPSVESIEVETLGIKDEIIRDKKHHGGASKAVCLLTEEVLQQLQGDGHPIVGGSTGENILIDVPFESLNLVFNLNSNTSNSRLRWQHHLAKPLVIPSSIRISTLYPIRNILEEHDGTLPFSLKEPFIKMINLPSTQSLEL